MKRVAVVMLVVLVVCGGCSGVWMNAEYSQLLDKTVALSKETADRAQAGTLTEAEMKASLTGQAAVWQRFKDARDGKAGAP
jgi:hypothetical protein